MAVFNLFKMLALLLISLVAMISASPIAASTGVSTAGLNCPACVTSIGKVCKDRKLSEYKCDTLWCLSLMCRQCNPHCPPIGDAGVGSAVAGPVDVSTDVSDTVSTNALVSAIDAAVADISSTSVAPAAKRDDSLAIPGDDVFADANCYRCIYINLFCKQNNLTEEECLPIRCNDPDVDASDPATMDGVVADISATSVAPATKREEAAQKCVWICFHVTCTRQCTDIAGVAAYAASGAIVIDETELHADTSISVTANHTQLENNEHVENAFLYHCDLASGSCWAETVLEPVAGTETAIENIPDIPHKVCREICNTDKSLCGLVCDEEVKKETATNDPVSKAKIKCHWECYFGQCWAVCMPDMGGAASDSSDVSSANVATNFKPCRWECYFGQCWTCCPPP
ncbi:uncharacterized protein J4E78_001950 [Alternaria triticimaculans]|uniref:uncharacterized protein n=1 Tax=Alternaria triticimaculans TaxID=297637 RepID=UPI0020C493B3|nr:uncharacterized protein J4E78_001950 [Alternaria triticimaculans]KAI4668127.1 hypothetical protein J4E78_001950 [Alternaria triticimaculans]